MIIFKGSLNIRLENIRLSILIKFIYFYFDQYLLCVGKKAWELHVLYDSLMKFKTNIIRKSG